MTGTHKTELVWFNDDYGIEITGFKTAGGFVSLRTKPSKARWGFPEITLMLEPAAAIRLGMALQRASYHTAAPEHIVYDEDPAEEG